MSQEKEGSLSQHQHMERVSTDGHDLDEKHVAADVVEAQRIVSQWVENTPEEKKLVRKLDWRILPCCWVLYLLGYLDRANIGYVNLLEYYRMICTDYLETPKQAAWRTNLAFPRRNTL